MSERMLVIAFGLITIVVFSIFALSVVISQDKLIEMINERCYIEPNKAFYEKRLIMPSWQLAMLNETKVTIE